MQPPLEPVEEEPDFMPRLRRMFASFLPIRLDIARRALDDLSNEVADPREAFEALHAVAHDLAGTSASVGAEELGEVSFRIAHATRTLMRSESAAAEASLEGLREDVRLLGEHASAFLSRFGSDSLEEGDQPTP